MITQIRRHLKSAGFKTALWIFIIAVAGGGIVLQFLLNIFDTSQWVFTVDSVMISPQQFEQQLYVQNEYVRMVKEYFAQQGIPPSFFNKDAQSLAKEQLIYDALLDDVLVRYPIDISPEYFIKKVSDPEFVRSHLSDVAPLASQLRRFGLTESDFEQLLEKSMKRSILTDQLLAPSGYFPDFAHKYELKMRYAPRTVSYMKVPYSSYISKEKATSLSDESVKEFFDQEVAKGRYRVPEKRTGRLWRFDARSFGLTVPEQRIQEYYARHMSDFITKRARVQVRHIVLPSDSMEQAESMRKELIKDPSQFEAYAREYSQDKDSAKAGGLLAPFSKRERDDSAFEKAAFLLKEDGAISPVVKTKQGLEVLQRVSREPQVYKALGAVRDEIRDLLLQKKFEQRFVGDATAVLRNNTSQEWNEFIVSKSPKKELLEAIEVHSGAPGTQVLYELKEGRSKAYLDGQVGIVVRLDRVVPKQVDSLDTIKGQVINDMRATHAKNALDKDLAAMMESGTSLEELAHEGGFKVTTVSVDPKNKDAFKEKGLPLKRMIGLTNPGKITIAYGDSDGYLIRLDEIGSEEDHFQDQEELFQQASIENRSLVQRGFIASLYRDATIKINNSLLTAL